MVSSADAASATPKVTVLMPVYNAAPFLRAAVDSILGQTFGDFELLAIDDGSTDASHAILESYRDPRVRLVTNERNLGIVATLNRGLELANGQYVARMDADDLSRPDRLARQVAYLEAHPEVGVCGGWCRQFGTVRAATIRYPERHEAIMANLLFGNALAHPTVMMRRMILAQQGFHYENFRHAEDYELWLRLSRVTQLHNLQVVLLDYRVSGSSLTHVNRGPLAETVRAIMRLQLEALGLVVTDELLELQVALWRGDEQRTAALAVTAAHLEGLLEANRRAKLYDEQTLAAVTAAQWALTCARMPGGLLTAMAAFCAGGKTLASRPAEFVRKRAHLRFLAAGARLKRVIRKPLTL